MWGKACDLIPIILLAIPFAGCTAGVDSADTRDSQLSVYGSAAGTQSAASSGSTVEQGAEIPAEVVNEPQGPLPFVRNSPAAVAPFPLVLNETVQHYVDGYLNQPEGIESSFQRSNPYMAEMVSVLQNRGLPKELVYLTFAESAFTDTGAGPWQLSPDTARRFGLSINRWVDERRDPIKSTRAAAAYLVTLHDQVDADWRMTLVAWNNGESGVDRYRHLRDASYSRFIELLPFRTRELLNRFMAIAMIARHSHTYGIKQAVYARTPYYHPITVTGGTRLTDVAKRAHTSVWMLRFLNPGLLRASVPPGAPYTVRVPVDRHDEEARASSL